MCGRAYSTVTDEELEVRYGTGKLKLPSLRDLKPNYNLCPTQSSPIILIREKKKELGYFRWGLVPFWAKDVKDAAKYSLINARGEEILEKRSYSGPFKKRRCIVPLTGFYEWERTKDTKRPFAISMKDDSIMSVAGVWEHWVSKDTGEIVDSFSIITTSANSFMEKIHDRMPVILSKDDEQDWLDPKNENIKDLQKLLKPCAAKLLKAHEISSMVNSPKNNKPEVLTPLKVKA